MRRKPGGLVPLELAICVAAVDLQREGGREFHGYQLAKRLGDVSDHRLLTAYGTLYRALARLEHMGLLQSRWEDPEIPARANRCRLKCPGPPPIRPDGGWRSGGHVGAEISRRRPKAPAPPIGDRMKSRLL